jgi:perosamine synthetase
MINIAKPLLGDEEKRAVLEVLDSGNIAQGPRVQAFEEAFANMCDVKYAVACSSGTTALHIALLAHGIGPGDEVITSPFTFIASSNSILYTGARPVFVDIDSRTFNIDPNLIETSITPRTKAILPIHLFGLPCDMDPILDIAERYKLVVIEDACQSHGARYKNQRVGSFGTGTFSFYPTKNITSAEGGMVTTNDPKIAEKLRVIRQHGMRIRYFHDEMGFNFRMTDIHAAIGLEQLKKLEMFNHSRRKNAHFLTTHIERVIPPYIPDGHEHVFHQYTVRVMAGKRDALRTYLHNCNIRTEVYYPVPVHKQPFYISQFGDDDNLPIAEQAAVEVLSLPVHPSLTETDLRTISNSIFEFNISEGIKA